jgi:hypothetical protein
MKYLRLRTLAFILVSALSIFGTYQLYALVDAKRTAEAQHRAKVEAIWLFLTEQVGTRSGEGGQVLPLNRADVIGLVANERVKMGAVPTGVPQPSTEKGR